MTDLYLDAYTIADRMLMNSVLRYLPRSIQRVVRREAAAVGMLQWQDESMTLANEQSNNPKGRDPFYLASLTKQVLEADFRAEALSKIAFKNGLKVFNIGQLQLYI